jgi:DNA-binding HxlR family transcriptional regulator
MLVAKSGAKVRGSQTGRPVMALLDLLGRRMTLRILWELSRSETALTFRALQDVAETNPALLNTRLKELRAVGLVAHDEGYFLTAEAKTLVRLLQPLADWAAKWSSKAASA